MTGGGDGWPRRRGRGIPRDRATAGRPRAEPEGGSAGARRTGDSTRRRRAAEPCGERGLAAAG